MKAIKKLNNNVIIASKDGNQVVAFGKGIGFDLKSGAIVPDDQVDQIFWQEDKTHSEEVNNLLKNTRTEYFEICNEIVQMAKQKLGQQFDNNFYFALLDHIQVAVGRFLKGVSLPNLMLGDIKRIYPEEYQIGLAALEIINKYLKVILPEDEAGFIAFHIVNYEDGSNQVGAHKAMTLIREVFNIVKYELLLDIDEDSFECQRFLTHLKFFAQRLLSESDSENQSEQVDQKLFNYIKNAYQKSYQCMLKIVEFIKNKYQQEVSQSEQIYLTVHIHKIYLSTKK